MLLSFNVWKTFGMFALSAVLGFCIVTSTDRRAEAQQPSSNGCAMLLEPLDTLHQDLQRIEEKLDALANPKWEYKILTSLMKMPLTATPRTLPHWANRAGNWLTIPRTSATS